MARIAIVNHNYATAEKPFHLLLNHQLASLVRHPPRHEVRYSLFYSPRDKLTRGVVDFWYSEVKASPEVEFFGYPMMDEWLFRRAHGRNAICKSGWADIVYSADSDYCWGAGCLDAIGDLFDAGKLPALSFPESYWISRTHLDGERFWSNADITKIPEPPDMADFIEERPGRAIGGFFIIRGDIAVQHGYLPDYEAREPVSWDHFRFSDDVSYKQAMAAKSHHFEKIQIPNLLRLRHLPMAKHCDAAARQEQLAAH